MIYFALGIPLLFSGVLGVNTTVELELQLDFYGAEFDKIQANIRKLHMDILMKEHEIKPDKKKIAILKKKLKEEKLHVKKYKKLMKEALKAWVKRRKEIGEKGLWDYK